MAGDDDDTPKPQPLEPFLAPMAEALKAAEDQAKRDAADREKAESAARLQAMYAEERARNADKDRASLRRIYDRSGLEAAVRMGKTLTWTRDEVEALLEPPPADDDHTPAPEGDTDGDGPPATYTLKKRPVKPLPDDCPVTPLGHSLDNKLFFYLSPNRQFVAADKHSAEALRMLFAGHVSWLWGYMPKFEKNTGKQNNWDASRVGDSLIDACGKLKVFNPSTRLRGVGAWLDDDDGLVLHCGDALYHKGEWREPGAIGHMIYPGDEAQPRPLDTPPTREMIKELLALLDTWPWEFCLDEETGQPLDVDGSGHRLSSMLLLGWIGCAMVGGALTWRPMMWLTGDAGSGKSTLQKLVAAVMGNSLVSSSDATAPGIYQTVGYSSRAVAIDEAEADPFSAKMKGMIELVRQSASGSLGLRGSKDAKATGFTARSAFLLSSIVIPALGSQDMTRITILPLGRLTGTASPKIERAKFAKLGQALRRRIIDNWPRWEETLERYKMGLHEVGHDQRGADQIGTLLAMADMLRFDAEGGDKDTTAMLCRAMSRERLEGQDELTSNAEDMLDHLLTTALDVFRGGTRMSVRQLVLCAAGLVKDAPQTPEACAAALEPHGVFVSGVLDSAWVTLPNRSTALAQLFRGQVWGTTGQRTGWSQAMQRLCNKRLPDGSKVGRSVNSSKLGEDSRLSSRGWSLPVRVFLRQDKA